MDASNHNPARRALVWAAVACLALLAVLSVLGAFLGAARAKQMFNSTPLAVLWVATALLLAVGICRLRSLRRLDLLLLHAGPLLVLIGAMLGSDAGQKLAARLGGAEPIPAGFMAIPAGGASDIVTDTDGQIVGTLPFKVQLRDVWTEYYPPKDPRWRLMAEVRPEGSDAAPETFEIRWRLDGQARIGADGPEVRILEYMPNARIVYEDGQPSSLTSDPASDRPAMKLMVNWLGHRKTAWMVVDEVTRAARLSLNSLLAEPETPLATGPALPRDIMLYLTEPLRTVKDYKSDLLVLAGDEVVTGKLVEVNHPLHYGGYHFYQYDQRPHAYSVLAVKSDAGLWLVWTGMLLGLAGVAWRFWVRPIWAYLSTRRAHGG